MSFTKNDKHCDAVFDEFARWKIKWEQVQESERPENAIDAVTAIESQKEFYPSIYNLLKMLASGDDSRHNCFCRTDLQLLAPFKNVPEKCDGGPHQEDRLSGLAHMQIHRDKVPNADMVLDELAKEKRKLNLLL